MSPRRKVLFVVTLSSILVIFAEAGLASPILVLDQGTPLADSGFSGPALITSQNVAQTVTTGVEGRLSQVDVQIYRFTNSVGDVTLTLTPLIAGLPDTSNPLFSAVIPIATIPIMDSLSDPQPPWTSIDTSSGGITFAPGDQFAIVLTRLYSNSAAQWVIWSKLGDVYAGGTAVTSGTAAQTYDVAFQTWVAPSVPEPSTGALLGLGLAWLAVPRRRSS